MTRIVFYKEGDVFYGFEEHGHTGYADEGSDILCSALSAMTMLIINTIEVSYNSDVDYRIDDKTADVRIKSKSALARFEHDEKKQYAVSGLFYAYYCQLVELTEEYYDFLKVETVQADYEKSR